MIINFHFLQHSLLEYDDLISCKQGSRGRRIRRPGTKKIGFGRMVLLGAESPDARFFCHDTSHVY